MEIDKKPMELRLIFAIWILAVPAVLAGMIALLSGLYYRQSQESLPLGQHMWAIFLAVFVLVALFAGFLAAAITVSRKGRI